MKLKIPEFSLVVLIGASGSGKSSFARKHFLPTEVISSDFCRGLITDDENDQTISGDAFDVVHYITGKRLKHMKLTVIDATNVQKQGRRNLIDIARQYHVLPVAIVLNPPESVCIERNAKRDDRNFGKHVIKRHRRDLRKSLRTLKKEGFRRIYHLKSVEDIESVEIVREKLWNDFKDDHGPFDIIGDVHGCYDELVELLTELGHKVEGHTFIPAEGRKIVFVGDLVDRGPKTPDVLKLAMNMVEAGHSYTVPGNHDVKFMRALEGRNVQRKHGLAESLAQLEEETEEFRETVREFIHTRVSHLVLDDGKLVVAHAGMKEDMAGRASGKVRDFALYGETTGETDEFGLPVRYQWAQDYRGSATVVYGHTPVPEAEWLNRTINIDTGCVFGGALTALRYPENQLVSVKAHYTYAESARPFIEEEEQSPGLSAQQVYDDVLDIADVSGKRLVNTRLRPNITIREENSIAALEVMSRFAINPKWLVYLPPTMSPPETSQLPDLLEHPAEAFDYYRRNGVPKVVCEEKHMGSRAIAVLAIDEDVVRERFGVLDEGIGVVYTRTGRHFFDDKSLEQEFLTRVRDAMTAAGFWKEYETNWVVLDCELMPWSAKAQGLLERQYAAVGAAGGAALSDTLAVLQTAQSSGAAVDELLAEFGQRQDQLQQFVAAYRRYCWPVESLDDFKLAPFHILATEGKTHLDKPHDWHMSTIATFCEHDEVLMATPFRVVDITETSAQVDAIQWWEDLTSKGGEGMVVKSLDFIVRGNRGVLQPAVKVRGREYLRIIYGAEYTEHLDRLRSRSLGKKRSMAQREFALSVEALERFVRGEPLRRVHECVFGILALESEPVDPRL